jgi:hypothetical protein
MGRRPRQRSSALTLVPADTPPSAPRPEVGDDLFVLLLDLTAGRSSSAS